MGLTMKEKKSVTREIAKRYQRARKKGKGEILDEFTQLTGYSRWYASYRLKNWGRKIVLRADGGRRIILVGDRRKKIKKLKQDYEKLNPAELKRTITKLQNKLIDLANKEKLYAPDENLIYNSQEAMDNAEKQLAQV